MLQSWIGKKRSLFWLGGAMFLVVILVVLASFIVSQKSPARFSKTGSMAIETDNSSKPSSELQVGGDTKPSAPSSTDARVSNEQANSSATGQKTQSGTIGPQYLIKTLKVDLQVKDTRKGADDVLTWITTTDPRATSSGTDYKRVSDDLYYVSLTFSVQATHYPQIYRYLRDYTTRKGGRLAEFNESVQDVTNTYVDAESRLQNLRVAQRRLQDLLSHAQTLGDILAIEQKLTEVEGQIESYEAQFNTLTSQVTFYTVSVNLQPIETAAPPSHNGWSIDQVFRDAFSTSLAFGQEVATLLIWLFVFSLYIMPLAIIIWLARKWYIRTKLSVRPKVATAPSIPLEE